MNESTKGTTTEVLFEFLVINQDPQNHDLNIS